MSDFGRLFSGGQARCPLLELDLVGQLVEPTFEQDHVGMMIQGGEVGNAKALRSGLVGAEHPEIENVFVLRVPSHDAPQGPDPVRIQFFIGHKVLSDRLG